MSNPFTHPDVARWREQGKHLPAFLRDFHDQKELFKSIAATYEPQRPEYEVSWVRAQVYVIDRFLWFLATHGYTIQKSRAHLPFRDLEETLEAERERQMEALRGIIGHANQPPEAQPRCDLPAEDSSGKRSPEEAG